MIIDGQRIGFDCPPYIVAEMSANHDGDINKAFQIIDQAKVAGASAVKIQTYTAKTITLDSNQPDFMITEGLWKGRSLFELYDWAHTPWEWHQALFDYAKEVGITMFSTPFDFSAVDFLENIGTPAYKIASFEITDLKLISYVASTGKPIIMSTGMANFEEINEAVEVARDGGCADLALLHCVSSYPAPVEECNLSVINDLRNRFGVLVGLSDHTLENDVAIASVALGATIIEKHFTLDRNAGGPDDSFSLESFELRGLVKSANTAWKSVGCITYEQQPSEVANMKFRRSLYFVRDMKSGDVIGPDHIRSIRPGFGLSPKHFDAVLGKVVNRDIKIGTPVRQEFFS